MRPKPCPLCKAVPSELLPGNTLVWCPRHASDESCKMPPIRLKAWNALPRRDPLQLQKDAVVKWAKIWVTGDFSDGKAAGWHNGLGNAVEALRDASIKRKKP